MRQITLSILFLSLFVLSGATALSTQASTAADAWCGEQVWMAKAFKNYSQDNYGPVHGPFFVTVNTETGGPYWNNTEVGYSAYQEFIFLRAYDCTFNITYLDWTREYLDWTWNNTIRNYTQVSYNPYNDTIDWESGSDDVPNVWYIAAMTKVYNYDPDNKWKDRIDLMLTSWWTYHVNTTSKIPFWKIDIRTMTLIPDKDKHWLDFDPYEVPQLIEAAHITGNATHLANVKTMVQSIRAHKDNTTKLLPTAVRSNGVDLFACAEPCTEFFRLGMHSRALFEAYLLTGDNYYMDEGLETVAAIDKYMWDPALGRYIASVWANGSVRDRGMYDMDGNGMTAFALAYQLGGNATYLDRIDSYITLYHQKALFSGTYCKPKLDGNNDYDWDPGRGPESCAFPDTLLSMALFSEYNFGEGRGYDEFLVEVANNVRGAWRKPYGYSSVINTTSNQSNAPRWYEYTWIEPHAMDHPKAAFWCPRPQATANAVPVWASKCRGFGGEIHLEGWKKIEVYVP